MMAQRKLPEALLGDLKVVANNAVSRRDLISLNALRIIGVNLEDALVKSARNGYHEITRGLRYMNVDASPLAVRFAVGRSAESYWALSEPDGVPAHPEVALEAAVQHAQWSVISQLLASHGVKARASVVELLGDVHRAPRPVPPTEAVQALLDTLDAGDLTERVLKVAVQHLDTPFFERVYRRAAHVNPTSLLVPAFLAAKTSNFFALLRLGACLEGSLLRAYFSSPQHVRNPDLHEELSIAFIETLAAHIGAGTLSLEELAPAIRRFIGDRSSLERRVEPPLHAAHRQHVTERWASAIVNALRVEEHAGIAGMVERIVAELRWPMANPYSQVHQRQLVQDFTELLNNQAAAHVASMAGLSR